MGAQHLSVIGMKNLMSLYATTLSVLEIEAPEGGRRSSQLPLGHYIANESTLINVKLTKHEIDECLPDFYLSFLTY